MIIIGCSASKELAKRIARKLKKPYTNLIVKRFPDGELKIKFNKKVKNKVIALVQSFYYPNEKLIEVL